MLNTAITNTPKFSSSGRAQSPLPFANCSTTVLLLLGVEASIVEGIARHLQDLTGAAPSLCSSTCHVCVCTVLREHCAPCSTSWAAVSSHQPSRQWDRGRAEQQGVTAGSWAWLRFLKGECSTTPRQRSLQGLNNSICYNRAPGAIVPLGLGTQWQPQEWRALLRAVQLMPLPLPKGCDIYMANTQQFSFMGNSG